jgi:hypothetical protein
MCDLGLLYQQGYVLAHYPFHWMTIRELPTYEHVLYDDPRVKSFTQQPLEHLRELHPSARLLRTALWQGTETANTVFHSDLHEGHSFTLLFYADNIINGGQLQIRDTHHVHTIHTGENIQVWVNQQPPYTHRVLPTQETRRVCSMEFAV